MYRSKLRAILMGASLVALYFYSGRLAHLIWRQTELGPLIWIPSGIGLAVLVLFGIRQWPWIALGTFLIAWTNHPNFLAGTLILTAGSTLKTILGALLLKRVFSEKLTFTKVNEIFGLLLLVMTFSDFIGAALEVGGLYLFGSVSGEDFYPTLRSWWLGQALGDLVVGALLINIWNDARFRLRAIFTRGWEALYLGGAIALTSAFIFTTLATRNHSLLIQPYFLFSLILWNALRFDLIGATLANAVIVTMAAIGMVQGFSPFPTYPLNDQVVVFQIFLSALGLTGLIVAASVREKVEALEARNEFLGIASHELKTPITSLKMNLQLLRRRLQQKVDKSPDEVTYINSLGKVDSQINRLVAIVEQLLDVSQAERKKIELHREIIDLNSLIQSLLERLSGTLIAAKCSVETKLAPQIEGNWDAFRIEQIIENLVVNAIKYAPGKPICVETREAGGIAEISVRDQGPGIDEAKRPFIFHRFVRANHNLHVQGLGLGLFLTREIVKAHGGEIFVESFPGVGARFVIRIPTLLPATKAMDAQTQLA